MPFRPVCVCVCLLWQTKAAGTAKEPWLLVSTWRIPQLQTWKNIPHRDVHFTSFTCQDVEPLKGIWHYFTWDGRGDLQEFLLHIGIRGLCRPACFFSVFRRFMQFHTTVYQSLPLLCGRIAFGEPNDLWLQAGGQGSKAVRWLVAYKTVYSHDEKGSRSQKGSKMALYLSPAAIGVVNTVYRSSAFKGFFKWKSIIRKHYRFTNTPPSSGIRQLCQSRSLQRVE